MTSGTQPAVARLGERLREARLNARLTVREPPSRSGCVRTARWCSMRMAECCRRSIGWLRWQRPMMCR
jgi:hypothetical protein